MPSSKSIFNFLERLNYKYQTLNFRFPIETLESLLRKFYKDFDQSAFLLHANNETPNLTLRKIAQSYLLKLPINNQTNENLYIGLSDSLTFLVLFDELETNKQDISSQQSRFFLTFDPDVINVVFNYFYRHNCKSLTIKEKKLLIRLKGVHTGQLNPLYVSKFQEALLINALNDNNKIKQAKILEAISFTDESVIITDLSCNIKEVNKNFEKDFGKRIEISTIYQLLPKEVLAIALKETTSKSRWQSEINLNNDGKSNIFLVTSYLFKDELRRPNGFVFTFKNITELKRLDNLNKQLITKLRERNVELTEVNKRLIEADRIKSDLLSVISHELKTPVSTILGFSELIVNREDDEETIKKYAEQINESAKNLDKLITDYLDIACNQFGTSNDRIITMPVNLSELIRVCYEEHKHEFKDLRFQFELNCLGYEPIIITEAQNMKKLFGNLINNSLKYSPDGGKVLVKILNDGENVTVSIQDSGIGINSEQAKMVFEPFYRADNSITREFQGIGLGLAVCRKIVDIYKGSIWCEPGVDSGTVFYVSLPVNPSKAIQKQEVQESQKVLKEPGTLKIKK